MPASMPAAYAPEFAPGLLDPEQPEPGCVTGPTGKAARKRYNVYRNNVTASLVKALADIYPATQRITGERFFGAMARIHLRQTPPVSPLLFEYGRDFPTFIERFEHTRAKPWLADVARIERAWLDAYHAADAEPLTAQALAAIPPERLAGTTFLAHPATRVVRSDFPVVIIFAVNRTTDGAGRIEAAEAEDALVTRPGLEVFVRRLPPGGAIFLAALLGGAPLGEAAQAALEETAGFDLAANIGGMLEAGAFVTVRADLKKGKNG